jgi:hypothetical protein
VTRVRAVQASQGVIYYLQEGGGLFQQANAETTRLLTRPAAGTLLASQGVLYLLEAGRLSRYVDGQWDHKGEAIHRGVRAVVAHGQDYFTLDDNGLIYSSAEARYLDQSNRATGLFLIGPNLLTITPAGGLRGYDAQKRAWKNMGRAR